MSSKVAVFRQLDRIPPDFGPCALTIGNFDGVHVGHREIMRRTVELARVNGWKAAALTFDPHPLQVVAPERAPKLMTTAAQRCEILGDLGMDEVLVLPFDESVARISPDAFVREIVAGKLGARAVLVGKDFRFGHKHAGDTALLERMGAELGFAMVPIPAVTLRGERVSSSLIRRMVEAGQVSKACRYLARPFYLEGPVVAGKGIGRAQTVPTLNLVPGTELLPKTGVYVTHTVGNGAAWNSITNVGFRPTFDGQGLTVETFLFGPLDGSPERIRVKFLMRLRDERKFENADVLKAQILSDVKRAQTYFRRVRK
jgi:riboflavin kinase/FMN adenylyltransferase